MDFKDYINELNAIEQQEAKAELQTFYMLHASTFKFFKAIDNTIQILLKQPDINKVALESLKKGVSTLSQLKTDISVLDVTISSDNKVGQLISYIKTEMTISEVDTMHLTFSNQCHEVEMELENKIRLLQEQQEKLLQEQQEKERLRQEALNQKYKVTFKYASLYFIGPVTIFIDNSRETRIYPNEKFEINLQKTSHKIKLLFYVVSSYAAPFAVILFPIFLLFPAIFKRPRIIEFDIDLQKNMTIDLKPQKGVFEHTLEHACSYS